MSAYKLPRTRNLFERGEAFTFSRSKVESFVKCPKCFYLDRVCGIYQPPGFPFVLNSAVDTLLKREFDQYRNLGQPHPLITAHGYDFVPFAHEQLNTWRENFAGARTEYKGYEFSGAIDDVWMNKNGELIIVDYKATAAREPVRNLDRAHHAGYKRQMEFYQWIFRKMGFPVSDMGMFVYCTGDNTVSAFDAALKFNINLIPYTGSNIWVEPKLDELIACAESDEIPESGVECDLCKYVNERNAHNHLALC